MSSTDVSNRLVFYQSQECVTRWFGWKKVHLNLFFNLILMRNLDENEKSVLWISGTEQNYPHSLELNTSEL